MNQAQAYLVDWLQLQNQLLYTPGVLNGLAVSQPGGNNLAVSGGAGQRGGRREERRVAGRMALAVVYVLEVIDIQVKQRRRLCGGG